MMLPFLTITAPNGPPSLLRIVSKERRTASRMKSFLSISGDFFFVLFLDYHSHATEFINSFLNQDRTLFFQQHRKLIFDFVFYDGMHLVRERMSSTDRFTDNSI